MPIKFRCQHCRQLLGISQTKAGESVDCPTCGRAVRVPTLDGKTSPAVVPKMNLQDSSLLNALDALAGLGMGAELSQKPAAQIADGEKSNEFPPIDSEHPNDAGTVLEKVNARKAEDPRELIPQPLPEPVELPPLEKPVALEEPVSPRLQSDTETVKPETSGSQPARDPLVELATLANRPGPQVTQRESLAVSNNSFSTLALVAALSFLAGFLVHAQFFTNGTKPPDTVPNTKETRRSNPDEVEQVSSQTVRSGSKGAVEGRVTFRTTEGNSKPDAGATVILLPVARSSSVKLPIIGFRPADHQEDRDIARASVRALGGDVCLVDQDGRFSADLDQPGNYHVLVLSHFQQRADEDVRLTENVKTILLDYFERPEQLPGRRRYHLGYVSYRGEETENWDYSFERL